MFRHIRLEAAGALALLVAGGALALAIPSASADVPTRHVISRQPASTITVTIPPVMFGNTDGLPATLTRGKSYVVMVSAMATAGSGGGSMAVTVVGGSMSACKATLKEITAVNLKCTVKANVTSSNLSVSALATTRNYPKQSTSFSHSVK
jgi:hypothetical protein